MIAKPEIRALWGDSRTKIPFGVTLAEVAINLSTTIYNTNAI